MDKSATKIIIIDDELRSNAPLIVFLQQHFEKVELYKNASDGIKKIENIAGIIEQNQQINAIGIEI